MSESDECPLCMEVMEIDDLNFFPCSCGYQICRFCWHRIRTDENGLCPACRKPYSEDPAMYQPLSRDEIHKIKRERKQREVQRKQKISESRKHLSNVRVIQKNLLFVVGLSQRLADMELLRKHECFGKYGKIMKVIINPSTNYAGPQGPSASAYITYSKEEENLRAILAVNNIQQDGRTLRVSLGTTKYCTHFLRNMQCKNPDCMYLHEMGDDNACFTKEDMQQGKHLAYERELLENFQKTQQLRRKSQDIEQEPQIVPQKEEWTQETIEGNQNSALPARAAWAEKECEKDSAEEKKEEIEEDQEINTPWSSASELKEKQDNVQTSREEEHTFERSDSFRSTSSLGSSLPKEILHPTFATGWATSEESKPFNQVPITTAEDRNDPSYLSSFWPVSDLGLKNLRVTNDDELGFDPFDECNKGLADLLATEKASVSSTNVQEVKPNTSRTTWPDSSSNDGKELFPNANKDMSQQYSLFGSTSQGQANSFFGSFFNIPQNTATSEQQTSPTASFPSTTKQYDKPGSPQKSPGKSNGPDVVMAWQDGLRALLPNVNISFSDRLNRFLNESQIDRLTSSESTFGEKPPWKEEYNIKIENPNVSSEFLSPSTKRPPPGFDGSVSQLEDSIWTKVDQNEKQKSTPPGVQQLGFPNQTANAKPSAASASVPEPASHPVTPWNAIVGRAQSSTVQPLLDNSTSLSNQAGDAKPAVKPVTSFAKASALRSQKPTAKVKPQMKCVVSPTEEVPSNLLQRSNNRGASASRMNDLDDISLTDPLPVNRNSSPANTGNAAREVNATPKEGVPVEVAFQVGTTKKASKKKKKNKEKQDLRKLEKISDATGSGKQDKVRKEKLNNEKGKEIKEPIKIQPRPKPVEIVKNDARQGKAPPSANVRPDPPKIRILKTDTPSTSATATMTQSSPMESVSKGYPGLHEGHEVFSRLAESTEKLLQTVLSETEVIKSNTEQISKDLKNALEKCSREKEPTLSVADWEKINYLLSSPMANGHMQGKAQKPLIDTLDLERQVESARKEAEILEVRLNDVIRKNMASEVENNGKSK